MATRYCPHCTMPVPVGALICPECGSQLIGGTQQQGSPAQMFQSDQVISPNMVEQKVKKIHRKYRITACIVTILGCAVMLGAFLLLRPILHKLRDSLVEESTASQSQKQPDAGLHVNIPEVSLIDVSIPDISIPDVSIPDIQFPKSPASECTLNGYEVETNAFGETVLYVKVDYKNCSEEAQGFFTNFHITASQNGEACQGTPGDPSRKNALLDSVAPDDTVTVWQAFVIDPTQDVEVGTAARLGDTEFFTETITPDETAD